MSEKDEKIILLQRIVDLNIEGNAAYLRGDLEKYLHCKLEKEQLDLIIKDIDNPC